jgi:hypothetical protein
LDGPQSITEAAPAEGQITLPYRTRPSFVALNNQNQYRHKQRHASTEKRQGKENIFRDPRRRSGG